jgi:hypothetical protein
MTETKHNISEENETDAQLYDCLTELYANPKYRQLSERKKKSFLSRVSALFDETVGLKSPLSKLLLFFVGLLTILFFASIPVKSPAFRVGTFAVLVVCILLLELSVVYAIVREQMKDGYYTLLGTTKADIERQEQKIKAISAFPIGSLKRVLKHLRYQISSRKSYLHFVLGGLTNLGVLPALFAIYVTYIELTNNSTSPDFVVPTFAAIVIGLYPIGVQFSAEVRR